MTYRVNVNRVKFGLRWCPPNTTQNQNVNIDTINFGLISFVCNGHSELVQRIVSFSDRKLNVENMKGKNVFSRDKIIYYLKMV